VLLFQGGAHELALGADFESAFVQFLHERGH
jgi:hypothetical protein